MKTLPPTLVLAALCASAQATIIQPDTAVASSFFSGHYVPENTINGSGLLGLVTALPSHAGYTGGNHWTTLGGNPLDGWIRWSFASSQILDTIYLWNHQSPNRYDVTAFSLTFFDAASTQIGTYSSTLAVDSAAAQAFSFGPLVGVRSVRFDVNGTQGHPTWTGLAEVAFNTLGSSEVPDGGLTGAFVVTGLLGIGMWSRRGPLLRPHR